MFTNGILIETKNVLFVRRGTGKHWLNEWMASNLRQCIGTDNIKKNKHLKLY